jgi:hypothetical protein
MPPPFCLECVAYLLPSLWHYSVIFGNTIKWKVQIEIDRKRKKDPGLAIFSPTVFETGSSTVCRGKKLDDETL